MKHFVVLSAIGYDVTVLDRQVIFQESTPLFGHHRQFALERPVDINNSGGIWYLTDMTSTYGAIPMSHLVSALKWCEDRFGKSFEPYRNELSVS